MEKSLELCPFGMLFEEVMENKSQPIEPVYEYDEDEDLNIIVAQDGSKKALVEAGFTAGTKTETFQQKERPDDDDSIYIVGTRTLTEIKKETSDVDDSLYQSLGTKTETAAHKEQSDEDPQRGTLLEYSLGTKTKTKEERESTDSDY